MASHNFAESIHQRCPINSNLFEAAIEFIEDTGRWETHNALGWKFSRNWRKKTQNLGILAVFLQEDDSFWQGKPEFAPWDEKKKKFSKYLAPSGVGSRAYLPPIPPVTRQIISTRYGIVFPSDGSFWDFVEAHPELTIVITEGGFKSLAALNLGYICISLYGVHSGVSKYQTIAGERIRKLKPELIPDLQRFAVAGRKFILAFDQDAAAKTRYKVDGALADLSWNLEQAGCEVAIASWDGQAGQCKGLDDLIVNAGDEAWSEAYNQAIPASEWRIGRQLAAQVKRQADLSIGTQEFSASAEQIPQSGIVALYGGKGTGKSEAIKLTLADRDWLSFTPLVSLGRDQAESWGGVFLNDSDVVGSTLLKDGEPVRGASVCIPSLLKVTRIDGAVLVLDELTATLEFLLGSKLANKNGLRPLLLAEFGRRVQMADLVILADADLTEEAIAYIEAIRGERAFLVRSDRQALTYNSSILDCSINTATAALLERVEVLADDQLIYINSDGKGTAESLAQVLRSIGIESLLITSETSGGHDETAFLSSQGSGIPKLIEQGIRAIITSPTVTQGFSIKTHTDRIDSVWGFYRGGSITAHAMAQALDRVRSNDVPRFIHVSKKGSAYSRLSKAQTLTAFMKEFKQISTAAARLVRHSLTPEAIAQSDAIDWQSQNLKMLASLEIRRNRGMIALRDTLVALLRKEGKQVKFGSPVVSQAEAQVAGEALKLAQQKVQRDHAQAVANATPIDEAEATRLSDQTKTLTLEQILSLEQWHLAKFYHLETIEAADVLFDRNGATQTEIRNLEMALSHAKATEQTARSINQNPENPQDWKRTAVQRWLMEQSGMTTLIKKITTGEVVDLCSELTAPIAQFIRAHALEFRLGFGVTKLDAISDQQIVGALLRCCGVTTKRHRRQGSYSIDQARLVALLTVLKRRQECDPPPNNMDLDQGGGSVELPRLTVCLVTQKTAKRPPEFFHIQSQILESGGSTIDHIA